MGEGITGAKQKLTKKGHLPVGMDFNFSYHLNIYSHEDVLWAMTTRFQADKDISVVSQMPGFPADLSQNQFYSKNIEIPGITAKAVFDCTVPFNVKNIFKRSFYKYNDEEHK